MPDLAAITPANDLGNSQAAALRGALSSAQIFNTCLEFDLDGLIKTLSTFHLIVCDDEMKSYLATRPDEIAPNIQNVADARSIETTLAGRVSNNSTVIVLSKRDASAIAWRCTQALGNKAKVVTFFQHCIPFLSCDAAVRLREDTIREEPRVNYVVLAGGRTGSTLLLDVLKRNGIGAPREHLRPPIVVLQALGSSMFSVTKWFEDVRRLDNVDGVFGTKLAPNFFFRMWPHLTADERDYFHRFLETSRVIFSFRRDRVAQAVSMFRADQSTVWEVLTSEGLRAYRDVPPPKFDFDRLAYLYSFVLKYDAAQQQLLASIPGKKLGLSYEELAEDTPRALSRVVDFIDPRASAIEMSSPHQRIADEHSIELAESFRREFKRRVGYVPT